MKVWRAIYHDDDSASGTVAVYAGSKAMLLRAVARLEEDAPSGYQLLTTQAIDVPQKRKALIQWLNDHASAQ